MIKIRSVTKRFGATVALSDVSAEFHAGEIHCLLGENGAGKSTIGKILGGLYRPDEGSLEIHGQVQALANPRAARRLGVAVCYQELSLARHLSVRANLCLGAEGVRQPFARVDGGGERADAQRVLRALGLDLDMEGAVGELPVAQQQLIEIGKALMLKPRAIIFDEPTAMLGAIEKRKFLDVLRQLRADGVASILITHHIEDVMAVSDRVTIMRNGKVVDSFAMKPEITEQEVVERLTGKKRERIDTERAGRQGHGEAMLRIDNLRWRNQAARPVSIHRGQIVSLYGVVGCGAESIVAALTGQGKSGPLRFQLGSRDYRPCSAAQALRAGVAYLPAGRAANCILPDRSLIENLTLGNLRRFAPSGVISRAAEHAYAQGALRDAGVKFSDASLSITSLSGGNQQKLLLARALAAARDLVVLEEPTAGVDIDAKAQIHARIRAAADAGLTVVMVSSDMDETIALSDVVYTLYRSEIAGCYEAPETSDQPHIIADVLGQRSPAANGASRSTASGSGQGVEMLCSAGVYL